MKSSIRYSLLALSLLCWAGGCQLHSRSAEMALEPALPSAAPLPYSVSAMHLRAIGPTLFVYAPTRTSFNDLSESASRIAGPLQRFSSSGRIRPAGPMLFVYHDPSENPAKPFDLEIGVPVRDAAGLPSEFQVRNLPAFHCATLLYRGPLRLLNKAYEKLIPEMIKAGLVPSDETRESYIAWESPESKNNVVQIQVGIR